MKASAYLLLLFLSWFSILAGNDPVTKTTPAPFKVITKKRLTQLIDSVFELKTVGARDLELLNYYASILKSNNSDSVRLTELNLNDLSFYSPADEHALFPPAKLEEIPTLSHLIIENGYLSYYSQPVAGIVTSHYGWRDGRQHRGIDLDLNKGDKVRCAFAGKIRIAKRQGGFGNVVVIMHPNGLETVYAHLSRIKVKSGEVVSSGQVIGLGGNTGHSSGSHLHFEVRYKGHALNPAAIISFSDKKLLHHTITLKNNKQTLTAIPANTQMHKVSRGESWYIIANRYGLSLRQLMALNGVAKRYNLKAGEKLRIN